MSPLSCVSSAPPRIAYYKRYQRQVLNAGNSLSISVNVSGLPVPAVTWYHNGVLLHSGIACSIKTYETHSSLSVRSVDLSHGGTYKVVADNKAGDTEAEFEVIVLDKPGQPSGPITVTNVTRDSATIEWRKPREVDGVKRYIIERRDSQRPHFVRVAILNASTTTYTATNLMDNIEYYFRIFAENDVGTSKPLEMDFPVKPKVPYGESSWFNSISPLFLFQP